MLEPLRPSRRRVDGWASSLRFARVYVARPLPARRAMSIDPVTMEELLATENAQRSLRPLRLGETVEGTIAAVAGHEATVDLGDRPAGVIPLHEFRSEQLRAGEHVIAVVTQPEGPDGRVVLSLRRVRNRQQWVQLQERQKNGNVIDAPVLEANRGGLIVDVGPREGAGR